MKESSFTCDHDVPAPSCAEELLVDSNNLSVGLAFIAGLVSFLSPCVLSLVPAYAGYLSSRAITAQGEIIENRWGTVAHGLAFVLGFSAVFVALGAAAGALGTALFQARELLTKTGGIVVILFGLHTMGVIHIPFLEYDTRRQQAPDRRLGYLSSSLMGVFFSAGWSPCVGPVLGAVLTFALNAGNIGRGVVLLSAYSLGLGIPFLIAAAGIGRVSELLRRYGKYMRYTSFVAGLFLIVIGLLLLTDSLQVFARFAFVSDWQIFLEDGAVAFWQQLTRGAR
jgi:cytochrome c-type biogenesis protein